MFYPNNIKKKYQKQISYANRGLNLENLINDTNKYYLDNNIAVVYKKPTPIGIVDVEFTRNSKLIKKGYFASKSTLDYNGLYKGKYIDFDAKETNNKTSFPLSNIHQHQIEHIKRIINCQGIAFLIVKTIQGIYFLKGEDFLIYIENNKRSSIPLSFIYDKACLIKETYNPPLDYLKVIDKLYFKESDIQDEK